MSWFFLFRLILIFLRLLMTVVAEMGSRLAGSVGMMTIKVVEAAAEVAPWVMSWCFLFRLILIFNGLFVVILVRNISVEVARVKIGKIFFWCFLFLLLRLSLLMVVMSVSVGVAPSASVEMAVRVTVMMRRVIWCFILRLLLLLFSVFSGLFLLVMVRAVVVSPRVTIRIGCNLILRLFILGVAVRSEAPWVVVGVWEIFIFIFPSFVHITLRGLRFRNDLWLGCSDDGDSELARDSDMLLVPTLELPSACVCCFEGCNALCRSSDEDLLAASMTDVIVAMIM